jgi:PAS domain S-box-containing protein
MSTWDLHGEYFEALHEIAAGLMRRLDPDELLTDIVRRASRLVGTEHGYIYLVDSLGLEMEVRVGLGFHEQHVGRRIERGEGLAGMIWQTGEPLVVENYREWPDRVDIPEYDPLVAVVGVPLVSEGKVTGVIALSSLEPSETFSEANVDMLSRFAHLASIAIDNSRLHEAALQEIRERKRAETELRDSELHYRMLFEAAQDAIFVIEGEIFVDCNSATERLFRARRPEIIGSTFYKFTPERQRDGSLSQEAGARHVARALGGAPQKFEWELVDSRGKPFDAEISLSRFHIGGTTRLYLMVRDVTERKELESQLRHSQKMEAIGRLSGGVAHDFNNLLTVMIGNAEVLRMKAGRDHVFSSRLDEIIGAGKNATSLVHQLLAFSSKQVLQPEVIDLRQLVGDTHGLLSRLIGEDVELALGLAEEPCNVRVDPGQLQQVLMNLSVNARDAMDSGGRLVIETTSIEVGDELASKLDVSMEPGPFVMLTVRDTGPGMDEQTRSRIFEPFFTTKQEGTGLGLSTAYGIVKQSGGHIAVSSSPGNGATFYIYLPRSTDDVTGRDSGMPSLDGRWSETVLLVEDNDGVRGLARDTLEHLGYDVIAASSGRESIRLVDAHDGPVHLLLTDVVMPGMNGFELAERLRESHPGMKVLFMSGYSEEAVARHGLLDPDRNFLPKPFTPVALAGKMREILDAGPEE